MRMMTVTLHLHAVCLCVLIVSYLYSAGTERGEPPETPKDRQDRELYGELCSLVDVRPYRIQGSMFHIFHDLVLNPTKEAGALACKTFVYRQ